MWFFQFVCASEVDRGKDAPKPETSAVPSDFLQGIFPTGSHPGTTHVPTNGVMLSPLMKNGSSFYADPK
jgi:hypothetical protein